MGNRIESLKIKPENKEIQTGSPWVRSWLKACATRGWVSRCSIIIIGWTVLDGTVDVDDLDVVRRLSITVSASNSAWISSEWPSLPLISTLSYFSESFLCFSKIRSRSLSKIIRKFSCSQSCVRFTQNLCRQFMSFDLLPTELPILLTRKKSAHVFNDVRQHSP